MATSKKSSGGGSSSIVKITDEDGRVHRAARGSAAHIRLSKQDKAKVEDVPDAKADDKAEPKTGDAAPAAG